MSVDLIVPITTGGPKCEAGISSTPFDETEEHAEKNMPAVTANMTKDKKLAIVLFDILHESLHYIAGVRVQVHYFVFNFLRKAF